MTNLKTVNEGFNKFCGPAVLSILTGKSTDECANVISRVNGQYRVTGVLLNDLLNAANRLGFDHFQVGTPNTSLYRTLVSIVNNNGMYIVTLEKHFVCIEVKDKKIYFCDNHTKEPIPAASSARLQQKVVAVHKVTEREKLPEPPKPRLVDTKIQVIKFINPDDSSIELRVERLLMYDIKPNELTHMTTLHFGTEKEYSYFVNKVYQTLYQDRGLNPNG